MRWFKGRKKRNPCIDIEKYADEMGGLPQGHYFACFSGIFLSFWRGVCVLALPATSYFCGEKRVYLSLLMSMRQLQVILDNAHLFDDELIKAAVALKERYENDVVDEKMT